MLAEQRGCFAAAKALKAHASQQLRSFRGKADATLSGAATRTEPESVLQRFFSR